MRADILFLMPRPKLKRDFGTSASTGLDNASALGDKRERSLPLLFDAIERVELSFDVVVSILFGRLEKIELRLVY